MLPLADLLRILVRSTLQIAAHPFMLLPLLLVLLLIWIQYRRIAAAEKAFCGVTLNPPGEQLLYSLVTGIVGGIVATLIFVVLGISLPETGILPVWILALILMLVHPRFVCFAYAGGIVALSSLLFGFPRMNVAGLMGLVAVLHLVEAVLIRFTGSRFAMPVVANHRGRLVGGFALQKFWPVPFFALLALVVPEQMASVTGTVEMPGWWPLIGFSGETGVTYQVIYSLFPVAAALGYGDIAITSTPESKARFTSKLLLLYSLLLLALAVLATQHPVFAYAAAVFSPVGHELLIKVGQRREQAGQPLYTNARGPTVLATVPGSPAEAMGLRAGDVIRKVNGYWVTSPDDILYAVTPWAFEVEMLVERTNGEQEVLRHLGRVPPLGLIMVPDRPVRGVVDLGRPGPLGRWLARLRGKSSA